nr:MAG TPA: hypothetical protein [Caudoviricetes sp.]
MSPPSNREEDKMGTIKGWYIAAWHWIRSWV